MAEGLDENLAKHLDFMQDFMVHATVLVMHGQVLLINDHLW